ncbi:hypothetical protein SESBI_12360 [Sesbania bispinosa]|nr:hypothetical protein SESBI_12360 [Sesbania bispinosa]
MGRRVPADNLPLIHPVLYLSFLAASFAASMVVITVICSVRFRKKSSSSSSDPLEIAKDSNASTPQTITVATTESGAEHPPNENEAENSEAQMKELPLPPSMQQHKVMFPPDNLKRVTSERRASFSLSLKMPRSLSVAKNWDPRDDRNKGKLKTEDSVWMKTIILGEKCVPDNEEGPVIYEGKGKRISAYHPKNYSAMSISRQGSFNDPDGPQTQEVRSNNT